VEQAESANPEHLVFASLDQVASASLEYLVFASLDQQD